MLFFLSFLLLLFPYANYFFFLITLKRTAVCKSDISFVCMHFASASPAGFICSYIYEPPMHNLEVKLRGRLKREAV